jgi:hypothetical protein
MAISPLTSSSTFYDWYVKTNDEIIAQLNSMTIYGATSGDGVRLDVSPSGILSATIGGTSGNILSGLTFSGKVSFTGEVVVPNVSFKVSGITTGTPGYSFGSPIRIVDGGGGYTLSQANSPENAEVLGIISAKNDSYSVVTSLGKINGSFASVNGGSDLTSGCVYFLDPYVAGGITTSEPQLVGQVSKPIIIGNDSQEGIIVQHRGNYINGSLPLGMSGNNRIYVILPSASESNGFQVGKFVSYLPDVGTYTAEFIQYINNTGRTIYDGWFISQATSITEGINAPMPLEEDFVVGMIETVADQGANKIYQIVTRGASEAIPGGISPGTLGWWTLGTETSANQLVFSSNNQAEQFQHERLYVGYNYNDSSFVVDIKPQIRAISNITSTRIASSNEFVGAIANETFNGDFSVWQRSVARDSQYTANTSVMYFADQWVRRTSRTSLVSQYIQRQQFSKSQTSVEGSPSSYIDVKCIVDPSAIFIAGQHSVGHIIDGIESLNSQDITISFYAKTTIINYPFKVYFARYNGTSLVSKDIIGTITPSTTNWSKYTLTYSVPSIASSTYNNDYVEIGFDLEPSVKLAHDNSLSTGSNLVTSFASLCVYKGLYNNPKHLFDSIETKQMKAKRYYITSYTDTQTVSTETLDSNGDVVLNVETFQTSPVTSYNIKKYPVEMRTVPTVSIYSPKSGASNDVFNATANLDSRQTSGTIGFNQKTRTAKLNTQTVSVTTDKTGYKLNVLNGVVPYDVISYHIIADASYPLT